MIVHYYVWFYFCIWYKLNLEWMSCLGRILRKSLKPSTTGRKKTSRRKETEKPKTKRTKNSKWKNKRWLNREKNNKLAKAYKYPWSSNSTTISLKRNKWKWTWKTSSSSCTPLKPNSEPTKIKSFVPLRKRMIRATSNTNSNLLSQPMID